MHKKLLGDKGWEEIYQWHKKRYNMVMRNLFLNY